MSIRPGSRSSDRETLRWACRESIPCAVLLPGLPFWGRSYLVDLRENGPRPQLSIAQPHDLQTELGHNLHAGDSVRIWSVREDQPWHLSGFVASVGIVEGKGSGPVHAAVVQLPYRLLATDQHLAVQVEDSAMRLRVDVVLLGPDGEGEPITLRERWVSTGGSPSLRGEAYLVELSRRTMAFSLPAHHPVVLLPGTRLRVGIALPDLGLRTRVYGRVDATMEGPDHRLCGLSLFQPVDTITEDEHRETLRKASLLVG